MAAHATTLRVSAGRRRPADSLVATLKRWRRVAAERQALARMNAHELADIGLSEEAARVEAARPFWDTEGTV
ncbi:MAG: DUF1127 domain-containing protein [Pseudomonadota bacterium]